MADDVRESVDDKFVKTEVRFDDGREASDDFFKTTCRIEHRHAGVPYVPDRAAALLQQVQPCGVDLSDHCEGTPR